MSLVFLFLVWIYFFFCWPKVVGGGEKDDSKECEKEIIESVSTLIILEVSFGHFEVNLLSPRLMETPGMSFKHNQALKCGYKDDYSDNS